ncbi:unnamed protein product [Urochloa humidicola]
MEEPSSAPPPPPQIPLRLAAADSAPPRRRRRRRMDQHQRVAGAGGGRGAGALVAAAAGVGAGPGAVAAAAGVGAGPGAAVPGEAGRRDDRTLTQREASLPWVEPNPNQEGSKGKVYVRKGIFMKLHPKEFQEIILKKKYLSKNERVNSANKELVVMYNEIQGFRLQTFQYVNRNSASKARMKELKEAYEVKMDKIQIIKEKVKKQDGKPVPTPPHFADRNVIFSPV